MNGTMQVPLSTLILQQSKPMTETMKHVKQFLDYATTQGRAVLTFPESDMGLVTHSNARYLNEEDARSRAGRHHYLSENVKFPANNSIIHNVAEIIQAVMSSAAEAKLGALYINACKAVKLEQILQDMGHPQCKQAIQLQRESSTAGCNLNVPRQWICNSIGYVIVESIKNNSDFLETRDNELCGLLDKAPSRCTSPQHEK